MHSSISEYLGPEKAAMLEKKYFLDLTAKVDRLKTSVQEKDMISIRQIAHGLQGSGKSYGFGYVTEIGRELSRLAKQNHQHGLIELIKSFDSWVKEHINPQV